MYSPEPFGSEAGFAYKMNNMFTPSSNIVWDGNSAYTSNNEPKIKKIQLPQQNGIISPPKFPPSAFTQLSSPDAWKPQISTNTTANNSASPVKTATATNGSSSPAKATESTETKQNLYKTELCKNFVETGQCRYGTKCQFAHGDEELRGVTRHPKYKTEICKQYHTGGTCAYGNRCRFVHHAHEMRTPEGEFMNDSNYTYQRQLAQLKFGNIMPSPNQSLFTYPPDMSPIPQQWFNEIEKLMSEVSVKDVLNRTEDKTTLPAELKGVVVKVEEAREEYDSDEDVTSTGSYEEEYSTSSNNEQEDGQEKPTKKKSRLSIFQKLQGKHKKRSSS